MSKQYLTPEAYKKFKKELQLLKTSKRKEVNGVLREARGLGDLSENAAYQEAKKMQIALETRIAKLEALLKFASIIRKGNNKERITVGSLVTVMKLTSQKEKKVFQIVGSIEAQPREGKISNESPLGKAFLGHGKGDLVLVKTPSGEVKYKIVDIS